MPLAIAIGMDPAVVLTSISKFPYTVEWAMSFHAQPARDFLLVDGVVPSGIDPSTASLDVPQHDVKRRTGSKIIMDPTRKHQYPPIARIPEKYTDAVQSRWSAYGFKE